MKYLIAGLGNIGAEYAETRHNIGFMVLDALAHEGKLIFSVDRHAAVAQMKVKGRTFILIKPTTYMNLSGKAIKYWMDREKILPENLLVVVDDVALPLGCLRMKKSGSDGGHNGLIHIIEALQTIDFARLRFGIGNDYPKGYQIDYVLGKWTTGEMKTIQPKITVAGEIIRSFGLAGIGHTMNLYNNK
jgi:peptidyl-tRNA hydrolase, PTH1 family